jgi:hypothetical protein
LGNTGESGLRNDVATARGGQFTAYNSLVGGYTAAQLNGGYSGPEVENEGSPIVGTRIGAGSGNVDGTAYGVAAAGRLSDLGRFFTAFPELPTNVNTGDNSFGPGYNAAAWDFRLGAGAGGAINGGASAYLEEAYTKITGDLQQDLDGAARTQNTAPDMGVYESAVSGGTGGPTTEEPIIEDPYF